MKESVRKVVASALIAASSTSLLPAHAGMLGTGTALPGSRELSAETLARKDATARLHARGVDPAEAIARVGALTGDEAVLVTSELDALPAGEGMSGVVVLGFLGLLALKALLGAAIHSSRRVPARVNQQNSGNFPLRECAINIADPMIGEDCAASAGNACAIALARAAIIPDVNRRSS